MPLCKSLDFTNDCLIPSVSNPELSIGFLILTAACAFFFFLVVNNIKGSNDITVNEAKPIPNDLINYVFPYI